MNIKRMMYAVLLIALLMPMTAMAAMAAEGEEVYKNACARCHEKGTSGAPKLGDAAVWKERLAQDKEVLYDHAINGFGAMPAKGAKTDLSDEDVKAAVDYMAEKSK